MAVHLEFVVSGPPISNQQTTPKGKANLAAWRATIAGAAQNQWAKPMLPGELRVLHEAEGILGGGFVGQSFIAAWAALESAMRRKLRSQGSAVGWGTSPRALLNELVSSGAISNSEFRELERMLEIRNVIVHGFAAPGVERSQVELLVETARRLLHESEPVKQTA